MLILLSNDDGVHAPGLKILYEGLKKLGDVWVVAPLEEKSTTGHSLTIHKPLRLLPMKAIGDRFFGVNGSPADCVYLGLRQVLKRMPDLVVSGINRGANLGQDVYYSGTVSAAREACILGLPAIAVSLAIDFSSRKPEEQLHYRTAARLAAQLVQDSRKVALPKHTLLNLNVPDVPPARVKGIHVTRLGFRYYSGNILKRRDHRGKDYFWVGGQYKGFKEDPGTDCHSVEHGFASVTPIKLDATDVPSMSKLGRLDKASKELRWGLKG